MALLLCLNSYAQLEEVIKRNIEQEQEEILIFDNKKDLSRFQRFMKGLLSTAAISIQNLDISGDTNVFSIENFTAGIILNSSLLKAQAVQHDVNKVYSVYSDKLPAPEDVAEDPVSTLLRHWHRIQVGAEIVVPFRLSFGTGLEPVEFYVSTEAGTKRFIEVTSAVKDYLTEEDDLVDAVVGQLRRRVKAAKKIKLSTNPLKLYRQFPPGTEFKRVRNYIFVTNVGVRYGQASLRGNANVFAVYQLNGSGTFTILGDPDRKLVKFNVKRDKKRGAGTNLSYELDWKMFELLFFDAKLNIRFVTGSYEDSRTKSLEYEYIYDLDYPIAVEALQDAIQGNLKKTQEIAIFRGNEQDYKGILIMRESTSVIKDILKRSRIGLSLNENYLKVAEEAFRRQELEKNFFYDEFITSNKVEDRVVTNTYEQATNAKIYSTYHEKNKNSFWHLVGKFWQKSDVRSFVETSLGVSESRGLITREKFNIYYNFDLKIKKSSRRIRRKFYKSLNQIVRDIGFEHRERGIFDIVDLCEDNQFKLSLKALIGEKAIIQMLAMSDEDHWKMLAQMSGVVDHRHLMDPKLRRVISRKLFKKEKIKRFIRSFERKYLKYIRRARQAQNRDELAEIFRKLFRGYKSEMTPFQYMLYVNRRDQEGHKKDLLGDINTSFSIDGEGCDLEWNMADTDEQWFEEF
jgi:hypothetical protein